MYEDFLRRYDMERDTVILHDGGNASKRRKVFIFDSVGFADREEHPSDNF